MSVRVIIIKWLDTTQAVSLMPLNRPDVPIGADIYTIVENTMLEIRLKGSPGGTPGIGLSERLTAVIRQCLNGAVRQAYILALEENRKAIETLLQQCAQRSD